MPSSALTSILRSGRSDFNARFAAARRVHPDLEPAAFSEFLTTAVDELVQATEKVRADRLGEVTMAAYDAGLELVGQKLAGPRARFSFIEDAWRRTLPNAAYVVATAPGRIIPAVCNAVYQLASTSGARPMQWVEIMEKLGKECADAPSFLNLGQLCAWRAGLAHFRFGALAVADTLPEPLVLAALGARTGATWLAIREQLIANPWFDPAQEIISRPVIRAVAQVGAFKGFGGLFIQPPVVAVSGANFLTRSDNECWLLTADIFGATFHRASFGEFEDANRTSKLPPGLKVDGSRVMLDGERFDFPELGEMTSAAANAHTLALTSRLTHAVILVALK